MTLDHKKYDFTVNVVIKKYFLTGYKHDTWGNIRLKNLNKNISGTISVV